MSEYPKDEIAEMRLAEDRRKVMALHKEIDDLRKQLESLMDEVAMAARTNAKTKIGAGQFKFRGTVLQVGDTSFWIHAIREIIEGAAEEKGLKLC